MAYHKIMEYIGTHRMTFEVCWPVDLAIGSCGFHSHPLFEIVYHPHGTGVTTLESGEATEFEAGSVMIYPPRLIHNQTMYSNGLDICVHLHGPPFVATELNKLLFIPRLRNSQAISELLYFSERSSRVAQSVAASYHYRVTALFLDLLQELETQETQRHKSTADILAIQADDYLRGHFETAVTMAEIANELDISQDYLRHIYKLKHGIGLKRRLIQLRIERARDLLTHSALPMKTIAEICGFENDRYFATCFKSEVGCSAGEFRRQKQTWDFEQQQKN